MLGLMSINLELFEEVFNSSLKNLESGVRNELPEVEFYPKTIQFCFWLAVATLEKEIDIVLAVKLEKNFSPGCTSG